MEVRWMAKISVKWSRFGNRVDLNPALIRFARYLERSGLKKNAIELYKKLVKDYLLEVKTEMPSALDASRYRDSLLDKNLSGSTINNAAAAIIKYHAMIDQPIKLPFLKLNNSLPYYFEESDVLRIFSVCSNLKHYCMLKVLFFRCLRSGELCNLDVSDYNPNGLTLRLRETKNNSDAIAFINDETARELNKYLQIKPSIEIDGHEPLFITDFCHRWTPSKIHRMFMHYKEKAGIQKKGGVHCFSRHSSATLMIKRGCDLRSVQAILRHRDIHTTLRYTHLCDAVKREKHSQYLTL
jgi:integrase/recombinase XerD